MYGTEKMRTLPTAEQALPGRTTRMAIPQKHYVLGNVMSAPFCEGLQQAMFGLGCFWGAERRFWETDGVYTTAVGYAGGLTPNPTYQEVCSGMTGHNEVVLVVFDPAKVSYEMLLQEFWQSHDPTQGMQQGNDVGTQYRSGIYYFDEAQKSQALASREHYQQALLDAGRGMISTEVVAAPEFYYAEEYHQQYLAKNPGGYCGLGGTGVTFPAEQKV